MGLACHLARYAAIAARKTMRPVKVVDDYSMSWEGKVLRPELPVTRWALIMMERSWPLRSISIRKTVSQ
jgi:hypothetical protein